MVDEAVATPTPDAPLVVSIIPGLASNAARAAGSVAATASAARVVARARNGTGVEGASKNMPVIELDLQWKCAVLLVMSD